MRGANNSKPEVGLLMVCLGNICRSPTAHGVMEKLIYDNGLSDLIQVDSAGTGDWHIGEKPDPRAIAAAAKRGYEISNQTARRIEDGDFQRFSYIMAMDRNNLKELRARCPAGQRSKLALLLDYGESAHDAVPDPYYSGAEGFELVLDLVEEACATLLTTIIAEHSLNGTGS